MRYTSESQFDGFFSAMFNGHLSNIAVIDSSGKIVLVNEAWRKFAIEHGASIESVSEGINYLKVCYAASGADKKEAVAFAKGIESVIAGERDRFSLDYSFSTQAHNRYFSGRISKIENNDANLIIIDHVDITERKKLESQLQESIENYRNILDRMQVGFFCTDLKGRILETNRAFRRLTGYAEFELNRLTCREITPEKWHAVEDLILENQVLTSGDSEPYEKEYRRKNGDKVPVRMRKYLSKDKTGSPAVIYAFVHDISRRKNTESRLKQAEQRFEEVVANAQEWVWEIDNAGMYTYSSPVIEKILGYKPDEVVGKQHFYDLFDPNDRARLKRMAFDYFQQKRPFQKFQNCYQHKDGHTVWLSTSGVPLFDASDRLTGYRGVDADITATIENENKLRKAYDELEKLVQQRTASLDDMNVAMKVLLTQRDNDRSDLENNMVAKIQDLIIPYLAELQQTSLNNRQQSLINIIKSNLNDLVHPFARHISSKVYGLTPMEIKVANLVRDGLSNKEIAPLLGVSVSTILTHRHHLREKLGLKNQKTNLRSHLLSIQ